MMGLLHVGLMGVQSLAVDMKQDLLDSGLIPKAGKCIWQPTQSLEWLGPF